MSRAWWVDVAACALFVVVPAALVLLGVTVAAIKGAP